MKKSSGEKLTSWMAFMPVGVTWFMAVLLTIVPNIQGEGRWAVELTPANISVYVCGTSNATDVCIAYKPPRLHNILCISHCNNKQQVWRHSPSDCWFAEGAFLRWPGWQKARGSAEERGPAKQNSQRGLRKTRLESRGPFCHGTLLVPQGPYGRLSLCTLTSAHSSPSSCSVTVPSMWMSHGQGEVDPSSLLLRRILSVFHLSFSPLQLSPFPSPPVFIHLCLCCSLILSTLALSLSFWGISDTVWKLGNRQLPLYYAETPPSLSLRPLFWQNTGCQFVTIGLLRCSWPEVDPALWGVLILSPWRSETNGVQKAVEVLLAT